jgi:integrase
VALVSGSAAGAIDANPVRDVTVAPANAPPKQAPGLAAEQLRELLAAVQGSEECQRLDLADPITVLIGTGVRRSELLAARWPDFDADAATLAVTGKLVRVAGQPLERIELTKTKSSRRVVPLPKFVVDTLTARRGRPFIGQQEMIFPSTAGTWRDPNNTFKQWRKVRAGSACPTCRATHFADHWRPCWTTPVCRLGSAPISSATPAYPSPRTFTSSAAGSTRPSPSCWTGP